MKISRHLVLFSWIITGMLVMGSCANDEPVLGDIIQPDEEEKEPEAARLLTFAIERKNNPSLVRDIVFTHSVKTDNFDATYLKWIDNDSPEMLVPTIEFAGCRVTLNDIEVISGVTPLSFAEDITVVVEGADNDSREYIISLNCPQINTELPVMHLQPEQAINSKDNYVKSYLTLYDSSTHEGRWTVNDEKVEVRGRGNSTWGLPKKPYRIKFPEKFSPIGLNHAKAKSWVILAHDMDKSLIRNHIAMELSRVMFNRDDNFHDTSAIMFTPCSKFVNVYMNGSYHGVYQLSDQMEQDDGRIAVEKLNEKSSTEDISGGYIIETDIHEGNYYSSHGIKMSYKYPKDDECKPEQYEYITKFINRVESVLYSADFKNMENGWRKYMDEKSLADFIIVKELAGDMDGYTSTYFYKRRGIDKLYFGPIWDCDKGWDNDRRNADRNPLSNLMIYAGFYMPPYIYPDWFHRLWEDETFRAFVGSRWAKKRQELLQTINRILEEQPKLMVKAVKANFEVWPFYYQASTEAKMPAATYEKEIERIHELTLQRVSVLDQKLR